MIKPATIDRVQYVFTFPFQDEAWKRKFLIAFLFTLASYFIPIVPWIFVLGYFARVIKGSIVEPTNPTLPEWNDWNDLLVTGLRLLCVFLILFLPVFILFAAAYAGTILPIFLADNSGSPFGYESPSPSLVAAPFLGMFLWFATLGVSMVLMLLIGFLVPPALGHLVAKDKFSAAFRIREWWPIFRANLGGYLLTHVLLLGTFYLLSFAAQLLYFSIVLCCLLPFAMALTSSYLSVLAGAVIGQAYRVGVDKLEAK